MERRRFLLLNATNYPRNAVYPYAFVQVSALARRADFDTIREDLMPYPKEAWGQRVGELLARHMPALVGVHVRQCDSQFIEEYDESSSRNQSPPDYFPLEDTKDLVALVKQASEVPVVAGGFGLTNAPTRMFEYLQTDFAVEGEPDEFFERYDELVSGRTAAAFHNVICRHSGKTQRGPRKFFDPNPGPEYNEGVFDDLRAFYAAIGRSVSIDKLGEADIPVEISRGCPYACAFCTEPHVKGRKTRYRDLDVVMGELEFLSARGVRGVWFVCSELNIAGSEFAMALAERMIRFNEERPGREVTWKAYSLPRPVLAPDEWITLIRSGYLPGWNGVTSFHDANLKRMKVPYRTRDAINYLRSISEMEPAVRAKTGAEILKVEVFLGNAFADVETVRESLRTIDAWSLFSAYTFTEIIKGTRLYDSITPQLGLQNESAQSVYGRVPGGPRYLFPTYAYPPALIEHFGSAARLSEFFDFVEASVFKSPPLSSLSMLRFLRKSVGPDLLFAVLGGRRKYAIFADVLRATKVSPVGTDPDPEEPFRREVVARASAVLKMRKPQDATKLLGPVAETSVLNEAVAEVIVAAIWRMSPGLFERLLKTFALDPERFASGTYSQYKIIHAIYAVIGTLGEFRLEVATQFDADHRHELEFMFLWLLFRHQIVLRHDFRPFFQPEGTIQLEGSAWKR